LQRKVFDDLGKGVLNNAWKGYNCSLFAYGQTGSGKSYSMVGYKNNKGIIPIICEELFKRIDEKRIKDTETEYQIAKQIHPQICVSISEDLLISRICGFIFQVSISMFEIYCEKVRDLLSAKPPPKGGLKIREHPKNGFYVEDLLSIPVNSYKEIEQKMDEGTKQRTIAATDMNATSSRAHTIVKIQFNQKSTKSDGGTTTKSSQINLVDLAGSERQKDAHSEGDRLKEGIVINQSLSTLGRVIKALYEQQGKKKKNVSQIPYRDSVLTSLLKNALGGNSKTIMIAALSPADINYEETLSTLRFADRAKSIKTKAIINESATERMIRELKEENARLLELIQTGATTTHLDAKTDSQGGDSDERAAVLQRRSEEPHLWNLNEDPALTDMIVYFIGKGEVKLGSCFSFNFSPVRIFFGGNHLYVFVNPNKKTKKNVKITYDMAQQEIARNSGLAAAIGGDANNKSTGVRNNFGAKHELKLFPYCRWSEITSAELILEEDLVNLLPNVYRANSMSKELNKSVNFEIVLVSPEARGLADGLTEIWIKVYDSVDDTHFLWDKNRFMNRYYGMQEMYQNFMEADSDWDVPEDRDPFYEPPESEILIGSSTVYLQSLAYLIEHEEQLPIFDFGGQDLGRLTIALTPCTTSGKEILGEYVEDPVELVS
uniref:Kinesin-like protein n=1 Tax=Ascaris lumbricoides TaxID=6252 RepID=A0A0M3ILV7_ASCLU